MTRGIVTDLTGQRFGRLTARWPVGMIHGRTVFWLCSCDCGNLKIVRSGNLIIGHGRSCGCFLNDWAKEVGAGNITHGQSRGHKHGSEYQTYLSAKNRCTNKKNAGYKNYGGRGIEFRFASFERFFAELGPRPKGLTVDRIDNDGHYEPGNVRWATPKQQQNNTRKTRRKV